MSKLGDTFKRAILPPSTRVDKNIDNANEVQSIPALETRSAFQSINYGSLTIDYVGGRSNTQRLAFSPSEALKPFQANEVLFACVDLWQSELASIPLVLRDGEDLIDDNTICVRFNKSSTDAENPVAMKRIMWGKLKMEGECFIFMDRGETGDGEPTDFVILHDKVTPIFKDKFFEDDQETPREPTRREKLTQSLEGFKVSTEDYGEVSLLPSEVLWLRYPHFAFRALAMAPGEAALIPAGLDKKSREWQAAEFDNSIRPSFHVHSPGIEEPEEARKLKASLEASNSGTVNAGRAIVTYGEGIGSAKNLGFSPAEMSYIESHKVSGADICIALGVPVDLIFGQSTFDNQESAWVRFWSRGVRDLALVSSEIDRQLFPEDSQSAEFDTSDIEALKESTDSKFDRATKVWLADGVTWLEYRSEIGEETEDSDPRNDMTHEQYILWVNKELNENDSQNQDELTNEADSETPKEDDEDPPTNENQDQVDENKDEERSIGLPSKVVSMVGDEAITSAELAKDIGNVVLSEEKRTVIDVEDTLLRYERYEARIKQQVGILADMQRKSVERKLEKQLGKRSKALQVRAEPEALNAASLYDFNSWKTQTESSLRGVISDVWLDTAIITAAAVAVAADADLLKRVNQAIAEHLEFFANQITQTTFREIEEEIDKGELDLADRVLAKFDELKGFRADAIARTESQGGTSAAAYMTALLSNDVVGKEWKRTRDNKVRASHVRLGDSHEVIPLLDVFPNGCRFPGDFEGPPGETINCRCVLRFVLKD